MKGLILIKQTTVILCLLLITGKVSAQNTSDNFNEAYTNKVWYQKALANKGDAGIAKVIRKAAQGLPVTIGFIGGSITAGVGSSDIHKTAYAPMIMNWWKSKFPSVEFKYVNAGIGATNSVFGVHRVDADLLKYEPDLVMVEYSVNDRDEADAKEAYEGLMRKILKSVRKPAVLAIATMGDKGDNWQDQHIPVCKHYNLPMISYRDAIWPEIAAGRMSWKDVSPDDVHPNDRGHAYIAGLVCHYFEEIYKNIAAIPVINKKFPAPLTFNGYESSTLLDRAVTLNDSSWILEDNAYKSNYKGKPLVITVKGGYISVMFTKTNRTSGGKAYVLVDGKKKIEMDADFTGGWGNYPKNISLLHLKGKGKHTLAFYYDDDRAGKEFIINDILVANY